MKKLTDYINGVNTRTVRTDERLVEDGAQNKKIKNDVDTFINEWKDFYSDVVDNFVADAKDIFKKYNYDIDIYLDSKIGFRCEFVFVVEQRRGGKQPNVFRKFKIFYYPGKGVDIDDLQERMDKNFKYDLANDFVECVQNLNSKMSVGLKSLKKFYKPLVDDVEKFGIDAVRSGIVDVLMRNEGMRDVIDFDDMDSVYDLVWNSKFSEDFSCYPIVIFFCDDDNWEFELRNEMR